MKWTQKESKFKYNGKPVTRSTATAQTPLGEFKVYEAVGGTVFVVHPFMSRSAADPDGEFCVNRQKFLVNSLEDGIAFCEAKWAQVKNTINKV